MQNALISNSHKRKILRILLIFAASIFLGLCIHAFADGFADGADVLSGTTSDATATLGASGKKWLYLIEGISSIFAYIKTKNVLVLGGVIVVAIMINLILHLAKS